MEVVVQHIEKNLTLYSIATKNVVMVDKSFTFEEVIDLMYKNNLIDVVVSDKNSNKYYILTIKEILQQNSFNFTDKIDKIQLTEINQVSKDCLVGDAIKKFGVDFDYLGIVDEGKMIGIVSKSDLIANYDPAELAQFEKIENFIFNNPVKFISAKTEMIDAIRLIGNKKDDCLIVQENGFSVGIITVKDILKIFVKKSDLKKPVGEYMTTPLETIPKEFTVKDTVEYLKNKHFKRAVVSDGENIIGILTQSDITRLIYNKWMDFSRKCIKIAEHATEYIDMAMTDSLTKAYNRNKFYEIINQEENRIKRYGTKGYSILICDVDHFKDVNDTYGHQVGDIVLKQVVDVIKKHIRKVDFVFRWGGDEFVILLLQTDLPNAMIVANKIQNSIKNSNFLIVGNISCSIGVSSYDNDKSVEDVIQRADEALYISKKNGRDQANFVPHNKA